MQCDYFGVCGGCSLPLSYEEQLKWKLENVLECFKNLPIFQHFFSKNAPNTPHFRVFTSPSESFRARLELGVFHSGDKLSYYMRDTQKKPLLIKNCPIALLSIQNLNQKLLALVERNSILSQKLFALEFLSTKIGNTLISLLYHKPLNSNYLECAKELASNLRVNLLARSRGQKLFCPVSAETKEEHLEERLTIFGKEYSYFYSENTFTQPNPFVNEKMIEWACECAKEIEHKGDLLELYCGGGNFTLPLSKHFQKILATEVSKVSISNAKFACLKNHIENITFVRLSGDESIEALSKKRKFNRLAKIDLDNFVFSCVFVDPPRAGLGSEMVAFIQRFSYILYISCNPTTLYEDIQALYKTHNLLKFAIFDQFPYTKHLECGVFLAHKEAA